VSIHGIQYRKDCDDCLVDVYLIESMKHLKTILWHGLIAFTVCSAYILHTKPLSYQQSSLTGNMFNLFPFFLQTGQKNSLTQETELLESLLQEVEHQVC